MASARKFARRARSPATKYWVNLCDAAADTANYTKVTSDIVLAAA
jgi:hypothetical protein